METDQRSNQRPTPLGYLATEAGLILTLSAVTFIGGSYNLYLARIVLQIIVGMIAAVWLAKKLLPWWPWPRRRDWPATPLDRPLAVGLVVAALSTAFSIHPRLSLESTLLIFVYALAFWFWYEQMRAAWFADLLIKCLLIILGLVWLFSMVEWLGWYLGWPNGPAWPALGLGIWPPTPPRAGFALMRTNHLAAYVGPLIPLVMAWGAAGSGGRRVGLWVWGLLLVGLVAGTGSRGGLLGLFVGLGALAMLGIWPTLCRHWPRLRPTWRRALATGLALIGASVLLMVIAAQLLGRGDWLRWVVGAGARLDRWVVALRMVAHNPMLGVGPGDFGLASLQYRDLSQSAALYGHAHNMLMHALSTTGVAGAVVALWLAATLVLATWHLWRSDHDARRRWIRLGALCGLVVFATHGLVDTLFVFPPIALVAILLTALALRPATTTPLSTSPCGWIKPAIAAALAAAGLVISIWTDAGLSAHDRAVAASHQGKWEEAVAALQRATQLDPSFDYYRMQLALAYGQLAAQDPKYLSDAITAYQSVAVEDDYAPNHANLAWLLWQAGDRQSALREMARAVQLAQGRSSADYWLINNHLNLGFMVVQLTQSPSSANYWLINSYLNLGFMLEESGQMAEARLEYARAVALEPSWLSLKFWDAGQPVARDRAHLAAAASDLLSAAPGGLTALQRARFALHLSKWDEARDWAEAWLREEPRSKDGWISLASIELAAGHPEQALAAANRVLDTLAFEPEPMWLRATAHRQLGDLAAAANDLQVMRFLPAKFQYQAHFLAAQLAEGRGEWEEGARNYQMALKSVQSREPLPYGTEIWGRAMLATDSVPFLLHPQPTELAIEVYMALGDLYAGRGMLTEAREAYAAILRIDPHHAEVQRKLSDLP